jgi:uncharacterized protein YsxB (DUF464 family)
MIKAVMYWNRLRLEVKGHADSAPKGQDIVCAGASMMTGALIGTLIDAQKRGRTKFGYEDTEEGLTIWAEPYMSCLNEIKSYYRMCVKGFKLLQEQYSKYVEIREEV